MDKKNFAVFGATGAIGSKLVESLTDKGHRVMAGVRNAEQAAEMEELKDASIREFDACDWDSFGSFYDELEESLGSIDGVAVCVGSILLKPAHLTSREEYQDVVKLNLDSCFGALRSVAKRMMKGGGSIVFCSSAAARHGFPNHDAIAAAKAGVIGLTLSAAATYASYGIRVNCVAPGLVRSKMSSGIVDNPAALKASEGMHAAGRIGEPEEVARAISWLLDAEQEWITGQTIGIDGGLSSLFSKKR